MYDNVGVYVDKAETKRVHLQVYSCQYLQLEQILREIYDCTLSTNSLKSCRMQPVDMFMLFSQENVLCMCLLREYKYCMF